MLRFAILKTVDEGPEEVVLEYNANQILTRLQAQVRENLVEKFLKKKFSKEEVRIAVDRAFKNLVSEFKKGTVRLK